MIGLVLVSHSAQLAAGVQELAQQMTQGKVAIAVAGGVDDTEHPIGTDPMRVHAAIEEVYSDDGVIVLMDLGSALMSAEMALEFLEPTQRDHVHLSPAPFVEGAITAATQATAGSTIDEVLQVTMESLTTKHEHLGMPSSPEPTNTPSTNGATGENSKWLHITVPNKQGLHARPAARLVSIAGQHKADLFVQKGDRTVSARNINQVTLLNARHGDELAFLANGDDADTVLRAVQALVDDNFGDHDNGAMPAAPTAAPGDAPDNVLAGIGAAQGLAAGTVYLLDDVLPELPQHTVEDVDAEIARLHTALARAIDDLADIEKRTAARLGKEQSAIFEAHKFILQDDDLIEKTIQHIRAEQHPAETAWWQTVQATADAYRDVESEQIRARAADVVDVGKRVLRQLQPESTAVVAIPQDSILAAPDLSPSDTAQLDPEQVRGIVTRYGGATSHTAIIARGLGIPAVVGLGGAYSELAAGTAVVLDGDKGWVYTRLSPAQQTDFDAKIQAQQAEQARLQAASQPQAMTQDKRRVEVAANVGNPADTEHVSDMGAEGVGLFRTELLFMDRDTAPDEDQQTAAYQQAAQNLNNQPVIIRTLDVGGDKGIAYIHIDEEENPFLGYRGVRYWLGNEALARTQLRAICRASASGNLRVMFPMVSTLGELQAAKSLLNSVQADLTAEGIAHDEAMQVGIMVEVPSAVLAADVLAPHVDFFSIGTNDLTQYIMATDRGNAQVNSLATPFQPAVLRAIKQVIDVAHEHGKWVGMCGEMAGNPLATRLLVGLRLDELSMSAPSIPRVKAIIRETSYKDAQALAAEVLQLQSAADVVAHLQNIES